MSQKRRKNKELVSESDLELNEISDYVDSSVDVAKRSASGDSEESEDSGRNSADGDNNPFSVPSLLRFISVERYDLRTIMDVVGSFSTKISVRSRMAAYRYFQLVLVNQELNKRFKQSCFGHLRNLPEHLKFNGQLVWIYEAIPHIGKFVEKSTDEPFSIPRILRWHTTKSDQIIEGDLFKYKEKIIENVHPYIIPTLRETNMDYMIFFEPYTEEVKNNVLDGLKKELEGVTVLISNEDSDDERNLGGKPVEVGVGDDDTPSTFKDAAETS
ncbi:hypothetical protein CQW23_15559 [Capsicum baccatum]|uniref:Uncharacterized protein n=1 Tax=Capsicum baccatum TaxID=33114 RepID=A0A2G2WMF3_CAPBA|nr:hypothetical protein CQW23_15559 [Capsicum baccatum]